MPRRKVAEIRLCLKISRPHKLSSARFISPRVSPPSRGRTIEKLTAKCCPSSTLPPSIQKWLLPKEERRGILSALLSRINALTPRRVERMDSLERISLARFDLSRRGDGSILSLHTAGRNRKERESRIRVDLSKAGSATLFGRLSINCLSPRSPPPPLLPLRLSVR